MSSAAGLVLAAHNGGDVDFDNDVTSAAILSALDRICELLTGLQPLPKPLRAAQ
jgi:hypothetical protein